MTLPVRSSSILGVSSPGSTSSATFRLRSSAIMRCNSASRSPGACATRLTSLSAPPAPIRQATPRSPVAVRVAPIDQRHRAADVQDITDAQSDPQRTAGVSADGQTQDGAFSAGGSNPSSLKQLEALGSGFDWRAQWYPVAFLCNTPEGERLWQYACRM